MDYLDEFLIGIQMLLALATIPLFILSRRTSRAKYARHESFLAVSVIILAIFGLTGLAAMYSLGTTNHQSYLLAVFIPMLPAILCLIVIVRASQANAISRRRNTRHRY